MGLILPPFAFGYCTDNLTGTPPAADLGTGFSPSTTANTDGTPVSLLGALAHDVHFLSIAFSGNGSTGLNSNQLADLLIDRAGGTSWSSLIDDLLIGYVANPSAGIRALQGRYYFPLWIPAGASLGVQCRVATGAVALTNRMAIWAFGEPSRPDMWWCGQGVESLGINAGSSAGTTITPGATGAAGTYTAIGTSTYRYGAYQFAIQGPDSNATAKGGYWNVGVNSQRLQGSPTIYTSMNTTEQLAPTGQGPLWCDVPAGTGWQIAGTLSGAAEDYNGAVYGVY